MPPYGFLGTKTNLGDIMLRLTVGFCAVLAVSGCGGAGSLSLSNLNPFNWGGDAGDVQAERIAAARSVVADTDDGRAVMPDVSFVGLDRTPTGVILRASGLAPAVGFHSAGLRPVRGGRPDEAGVARYELVALPPEANFGTGSDFARQLNVATYVPDQRLRGVRQIVVSAASGERAIRVR